MDAFEVQGARSSSRTNLALTQSLEQQAAEDSPPPAASKMGIGVHTFRVGKLRIFVSTLFYLPFQGGIAW